jgi:hypothetical protein
MVASDSIYSIHHTNALIGIHQKNFKQGMERRLSIESWMDQAIRALCGKAKRKHVLSFEICNAIVKFWTDNTQMSPNMKDDVKRRLAWKSWESHVAYLLLESQVCDVVHDYILFEFSSRSWSLIPCMFPSMCINKNN